MEILNQPYILVLFIIALFLHILGLFVKSCRKIFFFAEVALVSGTLVYSVLSEVPLQENLIIIMVFVLLSLAARYGDKKNK